MIIKEKSDAVKFIEKLRGGYLTIGRLIKSHRICDEITQADLARKVGISPQYLCDIEHDRKMVDVELAARFADAMGYLKETFIIAALDDQLRRAGLDERVGLLKVA